MFEIGENIVYPVFGAGCIVNIEENEIQSLVKKYYIIQFVQGDMKLMIPIDSQEAQKIRRISDKTIMRRVFEILRHGSRDLPKKWLDRSKYYNDSIKSGDILKLSGILNSIYSSSRSKSISSGERRVYNDVLEIVAGEVALVYDVSVEQARKGIINTLNAADCEFIKK